MKRALIGRAAGLVVLGAVLLATAGCQQMHYRVSDVANGKVYYTTSDKISESKEDGALRFTDARTGQEVTIHQTYRKEVIPPETYEAAVGGAKPADP